MVTSRETLSFFSICTPWGIANSGCVPQTLLCLRKILNPSIYIYIYMNFGGNMHILKRDVENKTRKIDKIRNARNGGK